MQRDNLVAAQGQFGVGFAALVTELDFVGVGQVRSNTVSGRENAT